MEKLQRAIRREQRLKLLFSLGLMAGGALLAFFFFQHSVILVVTGLVIGMTGLHFFSDYLRNRRVENTRLIKLLEKDPRKIVWVYSVVTERLPFGFKFSQSGIMYFKLSDGDEISVSMPAEELRPVSSFLNRLLPHASFGYTRDREQWYMADPRMLLKNEE